MKIQVISRRTVGKTGVTEELVERDGRVYAEQTRPVFGGTMSRRTILYPSYEEFCVARDAGKLSWGGWI
jgi:hypothetical protein